MEICGRINLDIDMGGKIMFKLLVVVDYQNDFVDGALGFPKAKTLEEGIYNKVKWYLDNGYPVVFTLDTHDKNYLSTREGKHLPVVHCVRGTTGHEVYGKLKEFVGNTNCCFIKKESFGVSQQSILDYFDQTLHNHYGRVDFNNEDGKYQIELVGVATNICVISNAVMFQTAFPDAQIIVDASLCASFDDSLHEKALDVMEGLQINVVMEGSLL